MNRHRIAQSGFSILELMFALMIFLTSFIMIIGIFPVTFRSIQMAKNNLIATHIAQERLEFVKGMAYDSITTSGLPAGSTTLTSTVNGVQQNLLFNYSYFISRLDITNDGVLDDIKEVRVQVSWTYGSNTIGDMVHYTDLVTRISKLQ